MLSMEKVHVIRHKVLAEGLAIRRVAREMDVSRNTVRKYLEQAEAVRKETRERPRPVTSAVGPRIDEIWELWKGRTTRKQRITAAGVHRQLLEEGFAVGLTTVEVYVREKRRREAQVTIPLVHRPGDSAQVDFFEVTVDEAGERHKVWKFLMRLMHSGRDFVWLYAQCDQVSFLDGHVRAFEHFGGVPRRLVYDNLKAAVKKRVGTEVHLTARFSALASHYVFEPCFARPGEGHDKGGVESRGKGIRLRHLTPVPEGGDLEEISARLLARVEVEEGTRKRKDGKTVREAFEAESVALAPLPAKPFEVRVPEAVSINRHAMIRVHGAEYSVPSRWARLEATAYVGVNDVLVCCMGDCLVLPKKAKGKRLVQYTHYMEPLGKKPQALRQVAPELVQELGQAHGRLWELLCQALDERDAARTLAKVLRAVSLVGAERMESVLAESLAQQGFCPMDLSRRLEAEAASLSGGARVPETLKSHRVEKADLKAYDFVFQGDAP